MATPRAWLERRRSALVSALDHQQPPPADRAGLSQAWLTVELKQLDDIIADISRRRDEVPRLGGG